MGVAQPLAEDDAFALMGFGGEGEQPAGASTRLASASTGAISAT